MVEKYRGITLLITLGKLSTRILNSSLNTWAEINNVYIEADKGFAKIWALLINYYTAYLIITST